MSRPPKNTIANKVNLRKKTAVEGKNKQAFSQITSNCRLPIKASSVLRGSGRPAPKLVVSVPSAFHSNLEEAGFT